MASENGSERPPIVVGWDRGERARDALALTALLARVLEARVLVVNVAPTSSEPGEADGLPRLGGVDCERRVVRAGSPAEGLQQVVELEQPDVVVLGSAHRGALGRIAPGDVAANLLHGSPCPVAIAPAGFADAAPEGLREIAVAYDASPEARAALRQATALARASGAAARLISVATSPEYAWMSEDLRETMDVFGEIPGEHTQHELDKAVAETAEEVSVAGEVRVGHPAREICEACDKGVDLLVIGSRGYGALGRVLLGSVSAKVVRSAPCPVMVVPPPERRERDRPR